MEVTRRRRRRRKKLLDDLKDRREYSHLKEEALDRTMWRNGFGGGFGPVVRQNTEWSKCVILFIHSRYSSTISNDQHFSWSTKLYKADFDIWKYWSLLPNKFVFKETLVIVCSDVPLKCFKNFIMYEAKYQLLLSNLFELCRTVLSFGLVSEVKRNLLCYACPWKGSCKENV